MAKYRKYPKIKAFSLGAAVVDDEEELDLGELDLGGDEDTGGSEEDNDFEETEDSDESDDGGEEANEDGGEEEQPRPKSRAQTRFQKLNNRARDAEAENIKLRQQLEQLNSRNNQPAGGQNDPQAIQAWLNTLPPAERAQAQMRLQLNAHDGEMQRIRFEMRDSADLAAYNAKAASNPVFAKYANAVETKLQELRRTQNLTAPREEILKHMIGELVLKNKGKPVSKKKADASLKNNTVKATNGKSNVPGTARKGSTPRERLEGVKF